MNSSAADSSPGSIDSADRAGAVAIFALLLALYTLVFSGLPDNPDAEVEFQTTRSLARHGELALGDTPEARAIIAARFDVARGGPGREERWYAWFGVGQALLAVPLYGAGLIGARIFPGVEARHASSEDYGAQRSEYWEHLAVGWRNPLLAAATAALLMIASRRLGASRKSAALAALGFGAATFVLAQARSTLSDVQAMFFLCLAFERWLAYRSAARESKGILIAAACALSFGVLTRVALAPAVLIMATAIGASLFTRRAGALATCAFLAPISLGGAAFLLTNQVRFGSPFETGYGAALAEGTFFSYPPHLGLAGLLISPGRGLLWMAPLALLVPIGMRAARIRGERAWPLLAILIALAVAAPVLFTQTWHGAWTYGPRYVLPCLPLLWPAVALAFDVARERGAVLIASTVLSALGVVIAIPALLVDHMTQQDLALQAARIEWPQPGGSDERERDAARFLALQWTWRFAAPWSHWRIAVQRAQGAADEYSPRALFGVDSDQPIRPQHDRERGWRHLAWVDLRQRLDGPYWIGPLGAAILLALAALALQRGRRLLAKLPRMIVHRSR